MFLDFAADSEPFPRSPNCQGVAEEVGGITVWDKVSEQILAISRLVADWDGGGALAVRPELICSAMRLIHLLQANGEAPPQDAYPLPDGNIILEWQFDDGVIRRIEVEEIGRGQLMVTYPADKPATFSELTWYALSPARLDPAYRLTPVWGLNWPVGQPQWNEEEQISPPRDTMVCSDYDSYQMAA
jgi:hypothetical protein